MSGKPCPTQSGRVSINARYFLGATPQLSEADAIALRRSLAGRLGARTNSQWQDGCKWYCLVNISGVIWSMNVQEVRILASDGGSFSAYLSMPAKGSGSVVIVIQEIFGINSVMRQIADSYAESGYIAIAPDLFWRIEPGIQLSDQNEQDWARAFQLFQSFDQVMGVSDLIATLNFARKLPEGNGKVGSVGYCLGGKLAYLMATRSDADCNVSYYGVGIENNLTEVSNIQKPLMHHIAEEDQFVPKEAQAQVIAAVKGNPLVSAYVYPGVNHAFARIGGEHYNQESAELANSRTKAFFQQHLGT